VHEIVHGWSLIRPNSRNQRPPAHEIVHIGWVGGAAVVEAGVTDAAPAPAGRVDRYCWRASARAVARIVARWFALGIALAKMYSTVAVAVTVTPGPASISTSTVTGSR
jgi:hypothetical protein